MSEKVEETQVYEFRASKFDIYEYINPVVTITVSNGCHDYQFTPEELGEIKLVKI
jgi:hypothetical protein